MQQHGRITRRQLVGGAAAGALGTLGAALPAHALGADLSAQVPGADLPAQVPGADLPAQVPSADLPARAQTGAAFDGLDDFVATQLGDVQSVVVLQGGAPLYSYFRDGRPDALRDTHSVSKSAVATLVGIALGQRLVASLDQPAVAIVPEWAALNADPRAAAITVRHLLTMTAGFAFDDPTGTANPGRAQDAWKRPLRSTPGDTFAYDNAAVPLLAALLEKATGMPLADYARRELVAPLGMAEPSYARGLALRTADMAALGQLYLQNGVWQGRQLVPEAFVVAATQPQNAGGRPVGQLYGYLWWVSLSDAPRKVFAAVGFGGQWIWVDPRIGMVAAVTSTGSADSNRRGQAAQLIRTRIVPALRRA